MPSPASPTRPVALVTGGAVRIGRAISLALAGVGYDLIIHTRRPDVADALLCDAIATQGARLHLVHAELSEAAQVAGLLPACAAFGPVNLLVNNASEFHPDGIGALDIGLWDRHFAINLRAPVMLAEALAAQLPADTSGAIVNLIDQRVLKPTPHYLSYSLTKQGLWAATRLLAQALAPRIRVNAVAPGPTLANERQSPEDFTRQGAAVLLGRGPTPQEIAQAVVYLATSPSVTGQLLTVDGGQHLGWQTPDTDVPE